MNDPRAVQAPRGWHSRGYLPHFDIPDLIQTVVFRLADSMPKEKQQNPNLGETSFEAHDAMLDHGNGACWLRRPEIAELTEDALLHFDGAHYQLLAWCVMPNHVHVMLELRTGFRLGDQVKSWKTYSARHSNRLLGRTGPFWGKDYFDRYIRNERHFQSALDYIEGNPVKAGLVSEPAQWRWSSARRR